MYFVAGIFLLACMDTTTKYLTASIRHCSL
jgi:hypothetical protein